MATTKIWPIKASLSSVVDYANNPEKTEYEPLREVLHYADNGEKTKLENEKVFLSTGIGCSSQHAFEDMMSVQQYYGKTAGNVAYHAYQSFKPNDAAAKQPSRTMIWPFSKPGRLCSPKATSGLICSN